MNPRLAAARALTAVLSGKASLGSSLPPQLDRVEHHDRVDVRHSEGKALGAAEARGVGDDDGGALDAVVRVGDGDVRGARG